MTDLVSDVTNGRSSCNKFLKKLCPHVSGSPVCLEHKVLGRVWAAENPFLKKQVSRLRLRALTISKHCQIKSVLSSVSAGIVGTVQLN